VAAAWTRVIICLAKESGRPAHGVLDLAQLPQSPFSTGEGGGDAGIELAARLGR
jgi:hypothetical protein